MRHGYSPAKSIVSKADSLFPGRIGSRSLFVSPDKNESKISDYHLPPYHNFKNFADFGGNQNMFGEEDDNTLGSMWTEDDRYTRNYTSSNTRGTRNFYNEPLFGEEPYFDHIDDNAPPYSRTHDDLSRIFARKDISEKSAYSTNLVGANDSTLDNSRFSASQNPSKIIRSSTSDLTKTIRSTLALFMPFNINLGRPIQPPIEEEQIIDDPKFRNSKGLRALSLRVKEVVSQLGETSYKEVADLLTHEVGEALKSNPRGEVTIFLIKLLIDNIRVVEMNKM